MTVVRDDDDLIVLYNAPGTRFKAGEVLHGNPRVPTEWRLVDRLWLNRALQLTVPGRAHSVWAFWRGDSDEFDFWYVNLQEPLRRTALGFDTRDNMLDIVVAPDLSSWRWKDEDDLEQGVRLGVLSATEAEAIRAEGERVAALIDAGDAPFDPSWAEWRPDATWPIPSLPDGWDGDPRAG